jgi:hypothetical protein
MEVMVFDQKIAADLKFEILRNWGSCLNNWLKNC